MTKALPFALGVRLIAPLDQAVNNENRYRNPYRFRCQVFQYARPVHDDTPLGLIQLYNSSGCATVGPAILSLVKRLNKRKNPRRV